MNGQRLNNRLILAVDNALMFLSTLSRILEDEPYELHKETTAEGALEFLKSNRPGIILLDIEMHDMDGYELCRKIKRTGEKAPILFISANSDKEFADQAIEAGAVGLLVKPLRRNQLLEQLKKHLG